MEKCDERHCCELGLTGRGLMSERNAFAEYMFGGGFEADAKKGVADAIAELIAADIEPVNSSTLQK